MRTIGIGLVLTAVVACLAAAPAAAQEGEMEKAKTAAAAAEHQHHEHGMMSAPPEFGLVKALVRSFDDASGKLASLAEAVPQEKYGWRPADGVRSASEVFMHVAGGNYFLSGGLGVAMPEGLSPEMEKETDKAKVLAALKASIDHARAAIEGASDLGAEVELFGQKFTKADVVAILVGHAHEHLGQAIAYARSNGVVPPWSQPAPAAAEGGGGEGGR